MGKKKKKTATTDDQTGSNSSSVGGSGNNSPVTNQSPPGSPKVINEPAVSIIDDKTATPTKTGDNVTNDMEKIDEVDGDDINKSNPTNVEGSASDYAGPSTFNKPEESQSDATEFFEWRGFDGKDVRSLSMQENINVQENFPAYPNESLDDYME